MIIEIYVLFLILDGVAVVIYNMMNTFAGMSHNGIAITISQVPIIT